MTFEEADNDAGYLLWDGAVIGIAGQTSADSLSSVDRQRRSFVAVLEEVTFEEADNDAGYLLWDGAVIGIAGQTSADSLSSFF